MSLKDQAISGVKFTAISSFFNICSRIVQLVVLARLLSPTDFGLMAMVTIVVGFARTFSDFGLSGAIIHRQNPTIEQLSTLYWVNIIWGVVIFFLVWISTPIIVVFFKEPQLYELLHVMAFIFIIISFGVQFQTLLQKELFFKKIAQIEIVGLSIEVFVSVCLAFLGFGVWAIIFGFMGNMIIKTLLLVEVGLRKFRPRIYFSGKDLEGYLNFGFYQMGERSINYFVSRLDQVIIGSLLGTSVLGFYNFAFNLVNQPLERINPIVTKVAFPLFSKVQNDRNKLKNGYLKVVNMLAGVNAPILIGLLFLSNLIVPIVFGEKWNNSIGLIQILSLVALLKVIGNPVGSLLLAKGRADLGFKWILFYPIITFPFVFSGAYFYGELGVTVALLIVHLFLFFPAYIFLIRPIIGGCIKSYLKVIFRPIIITFFIFGLTNLIFSIFVGVNLKVILIAQTIFAISGYIILFRYFEKDLFLSIKSIFIK